MVCPLPEALPGVFDSVVDALVDEAVDEVVDELPDFVDGFPETDGISSGLGTVILRGAVLASPGANGGRAGGTIFVVGGGRVAEGRAGVVAGSVAPGTGTGTGIVIWPPPIGTPPGTGIVTGPPAEGVSGPPGLRPGERLASSAERLP